MTQVAIVAPEVAQELGVNADLALAFLEMAASGRGQEALDRYGGLEFRHHNPYFAGDGGTLVAAMDEDVRTKPGKRLEVMRIISEGPYVAIHSKVTGSTDHDLATVHIFRIEDGKIVELWDVAQEAPADSPNQYGMF
jgi:predicted SnoaL-like aldol condensation-catalyzing enzyme